MTIDIGIALPSNSMCLNTEVTAVVVEKRRQFPMAWPLNNKCEETLLGQSSRTSRRTRTRGSEDKNQITHS